MLVTLTLVVALLVPSQAEAFAPGEEDDWLLPGARRLQDDPPRQKPICIRPPDQCRCLYGCSVMGGDSKMCEGTSGEKRKEIWTSMPKERLCDVAKCFGFCSKEVRGCRD